MEALIQKQKNRIKLIAIIMAVILILASSAVYLVTSEEFFRAEVLEYFGGAPTAEGDYYMPDYIGAPGSIGEIEIISNMSEVKLNGLTFNLEYNGTLATAVKIITDGTALDGFIKDLNTDIPTGASIGLAAADPVDINVGDRIVKIRLQIGKNVPQGTTIDLSADASTLIEDVNGNLQSTPISISAGSITVTGTAVTPTLLIRSVRPANISNQEEQSIVVEGSNFQDGTDLYLGDQKLLTSTRSETSITGIVPQGFTPGIYTVLVTNPDGSNAKMEDSVIVSKEIIGQIEFIEEEFKTVPDRVPNDGETEITLWVKVKDPLGVSDIANVNVDLSNVGGTTTNSMIAGEIIEHTRWYYLSVKVPGTVSTADTPYSLPVTATNIAGRNANAELDLLVTKQSVGSVAPTIIEAYTKPIEGLTPGDTIDFFIHVNDNDGISDIKQVILNLVPIGGDPVRLTPLTGESTATAGTTTGNETKNGESKITYQWYTYKDFQIPYETDPGTYQITATATDKTGVSGERQLSIQIQSHQASIIDQIFTQPTKDIVAGENISFYVNIKNQSSIREVKDVIINLVEIGGAPIPMLPINIGATTQSFPKSSSRTAETKEEATIANTQFITTDVFTDTQTTGGGSATTNDSNQYVTSQWYALIDFKLPLDSEGSYDIPITVTDKRGATGTKELELKILSPAELTKFAPKIDEQRSYTNPYISINDETTPVTVYVFVKHRSELQNVIMNLRNIGMLAPDQSGPSFTQEDEDNGGTLLKADIFDGDLPTVDRQPSPQSTPPSGCSTNSNTILCLEPTAREGDIGTWFKSPPIVILKETIPSTEPYKIEVTATDASGRIGQGFIPLIVNDGGKYVVDNVPPKANLAVATGSDTLEILFSEELDPSTVRINGGNFKITEFDDISKGLSVKRATLNASATVATLTTAEQKPGVYYAVTVDTKISDAVGILVAKGSFDRARFIGYEHSRIPPTVRTLTATSENSLEIAFTAPVKPSSLVLTFIRPEGVQQATTAAPRAAVGHLYYSGENFIIRESGLEKTPLNITGVNFGNDSHMIIIETAIQQANQEYLLSGGGFASYNGTIIKKGRLNKFFKGYVSKLREAPALRRSADFNQDGKVNFLDFTIFATFYGKQTGGGEIDKSPDIAPPAAPSTNTLPPAATTPTPPATTPTPPATTPTPPATNKNTNTDTDPNSTTPPPSGGSDLSPFTDGDVSHPFVDF